MPSLLWVCKTSSSLKLSQSSRGEESEIRKHVQEVRTKRLRTDRTPIAPKDNGGDGKAVDQPRGIIKWRSRPQQTSRIIQQRRAIQRPAVALQLRTFELAAAEQRSLQFFQIRTSDEWSGWTDLDFWSRAVLQLSHTSKILAHSLIALSAYHEALVSSLNKGRTDFLHRFSFFQSSKAALTGKDDALSYVEAIASCIVFYCLQSLQRPHAAIPFLRSGLNMLEESSRPGRVTAEEGAFIESSLRPLLNHLRRRPCQMNDATTVFRLSTEWHQKHAIGSPTHQDLAPQTSFEFFTAAEARESLQAILNWAHDNFPSHKSRLSSVQAFYKAFDDGLARWSSELTHLTVNNESCSSWGANAAQLLRVSMLFGKIVVHTSAAGSEMVFDEYLADFQEMVSMLEIVRQNAEPGCNVSFGIDGGLVDIIAFIGVKCRDPFIRRRALELLQHTGRVEGDRQARVPGEILQTLIDVEEAGRSVLSCRDITANDRRRIVGGCQYFQTRRVQVLLESTESSSWDAGQTPSKWYDVDLLLSPPTENQPTVLSDVPDVVIGSGFISYLEDRSTERYFELQLDRFSFPIPRV